MTAFITSLAVTGLMVGIVILVGKRRQPGTPLTWGEAFIAATFAFALLLMIYGVVPDRWQRDGVSRPRRYPVHPRARTAAPG